eukprot:g1596.t1
MEYHRGNQLSTRSMESQLLGGRPPERLIERAAFYIQDAFDGINRVHPLQTPFARRCYFAYLSVEPLLGHVPSLLILLTFFEKPHWCYGEGEGRCGNPQYPTFSLPFFSRNAGLAVETVLLLLLVLELVLKILCSGLRRLLSHAGSRTEAFRQQFGIVLVSIIELIVAWSTPAYTLRIAPYLRAGLFTLNSPGVRFELQLFAAILPEFLPVFFLMVLYVLFYAIFGMLVFKNDTEEGAVDFCSLRRSMWTLLILLSTANFPDVMMPAYSRNRFAGVFFATFVIVGIFILINILLAIVVDAYLSSKERQRAQLEEQRSKNLQKAFRLIDEAGRDGDDPASSEPGFISHDEVMGVFTELNRYKNIAFIGDVKREILFACLDEDGDRRVDESEFMELTKVLELELLRVDAPSFFDRWLESHLEDHADEDEDEDEHEDEGRTKKQAVEGESNIEDDGEEGGRRARKRWQQLKQQVSGRGDGRGGRRSRPLLERQATASAAAELLSPSLGRPLLAREHSSLRKQALMPDAPARRGRKLKRNAPAWLRCCARTVQLPFKLVLHPRFDDCVDVMLALNVLAVMVLSRHRFGDEQCVIASGGGGGDGDGGDGGGGSSDPSLEDGRFDPHSVWDWLQLLLTLFFTAEMLFKIGALGFRRYWADWCRRFDMLVTVATAFLVVVVYSPQIKHLRGFANERIITYMWLVRFTRLSRCLRRIKRFEVLMLTLESLVYPAGRLLRLLFCIFFLYSVLGMQIFGGMITTDPDNPYNAMLNATDFGGANYYPNNFNDLWSGFFTLFELLVVNNWFEIVDGFVAVTTIHARWYFISFYLLGVMVSFNIVIASVLDTFAVENKVQYEIAGHATSVRNQQTGVHEAEVTGAGAVFDASGITGTSTGVDGVYRASLPRKTASSNAYLRHLFQGGQAEGTDRGAGAAQA